MKLDRKLNIVLPTDIGLVHSQPIGREVFDKYFDIISLTYSRITTEGYSNQAGSRIAYLMLKRVAEERNCWEGNEGVAIGLVSEIVRLSNVLTQTPKGWETLPLQHVFTQESMNPEVRAEVVNALVFFTLVSWVERKQDVPLMVTGLAGYWGGLTTLDDCTAYRMSLKTSTTEDSTGKKETQSSIPS